LQIGVHEIVADKQEWLAALTGECIGKAVSKIEAASLEMPRRSAESGIGVLRSGGNTQEIQ